MKVTILKKYKKFRKGTEVVFTNEKARELIKEGFAVEFGKEVKKNIPKKGKKKQNLEQ